MEYGRERFDPRTMRLGDIVGELARYEAMDILRKQGLIPTRVRDMEQGARAIRSRKNTLYDELDRREREYKAR